MPRGEAVAEVYAEWLASQHPALARAAAQGFAGDAALLAAALARDPALRQTLVRLANDASDEQLRLAARRALVARQRKREASAAKASAQPAAGERE